MKMSGTSDPVQHEQARTRRCGTIPAPLRDPQKFFHSAHRRLERVLDLDVVSPPQTRTDCRWLEVRRPGDGCAPETIKVSPRWRRLAARLGPQMGTANKQLVTECMEAIVGVFKPINVVAEYTEAVSDDRANNGIFLSNLSSEFVVLGTRLLKCGAGLLRRC